MLMVRDLTLTELQGYLGDTELTQYSPIDAIKTIFGHLSQKEIKFAEDFYSLISKHELFKRLDVNVINNHTHIAPFLGSKGECIAVGTSYTNQNIVHKKLPIQSPLLRLYYSKREACFYLAVMNEAGFGELSEDKREEFKDNFKPPLPTPQMVKVVNKESSEKTNEFLLKLNEYVNEAPTLKEFLNKLAELKTLFPEQLKQRLKSNMPVIRFIKKEKKNPETSDGETTGVSMSTNISLNTILYGPPGTGKTYSTIEKAVQIIEGDDYDERRNRETLKTEFDRLLSVNQIGFTTFHPSYSYEDFVIGYKPHNVKGPNDTMQISYEPTAGIFYQMCKLAFDNKNKKYVLIIDEINRGNLSSIFGELMTLIEDSKRIDAEEEIRLVLPIKIATDNDSNFLTDGKFGVPENLYVLGTMNTADRSAALMDVALRRRFVFEYMPPKYDLLDFNVNKDDNKIHIGDLLKNLNLKIEKQRDRDHTIGHASFIKLKESKSPILLHHIFKQSILPLLEEYFYEDWKGLKEIVPDLITETDGVYRWCDCVENNDDIDTFITALSTLVK